MDTEFLARMRYTKVLERERPNNKRGYLFDTSFHIVFHATKIGLAFCKIHIQPYISRGPNHLLDNQLIRFPISSCKQYKVLCKAYFNDIEFLTYCI